MALSLALVAVGLLVAAASASAAVTESQITSPSSPTFSLAEFEPPNTFAVSGTSNGEIGDEVDIYCYYSEEGSTERQLVASNVPVEEDGSFAAAELEFGEISQRLCRLVAIDTGSEPTNLAPFEGPVMATGEFEPHFIGEGPNSGTVFDFYAWGQQLTAAGDYTSAGNCGYTDGYLFTGFEQTTSTFYCNDYFGSYEGPNSESSTRSQIQVDGANAYASQTAERINREAENFPTITFTHEINPLNGDLTIHESDEIAKCADPAYPPTEESCPSFEPTGVRLDRTMVQNHDGHLTTVTDTWVSTDGKQHTLDLLPQNDQYFGPENEGAGEKVAYRFPGEVGYSTHPTGTVLPVTSTTPGTVYINVEGAPDGDTETGQGAIVFDRPIGSATFNSEPEPQAEGRSSVEFHQTGIIPAGGSTTFRTAYAQAYTSAAVAALVAEAEAAFRPAPTPTPTPSPTPTPAATVSPKAAPPAVSSAFGLRKVRLSKTKGKAMLKVYLPGPGQLSLSGKKVKAATVKSTAAGIVAIAVAPKAGLAKKLAAGGRAKVSVTLAFTPTGGSVAAKTKKVTLVRNH